MNSFSELADGNGPNFLLRWRGRQEGPYAAAVIEAKLTANEIGLLHEISYQGRWITIRDYITEREIVLHAERQAREEREQKARAEEAKRKEEAEREAQKPQRAARLPEPAQAQPSLPSAPPEASGLRSFGSLLLIIGLAIAGYFFLAFDTSVTSGLGRINNLGLMADRQNGIMVGIGLSVIGTIMLAVGKGGKN